MLIIKNITKVFNKGKEDEVQALKGLSFQINDGEFVVIVGENGSGKTTLLNLIQGTEMPTNGKIEINNKDITALAGYKRSRFVSRVFQNPNSGVAPDLSVLNNFRLAALRSKRKNLLIGNNNAFQQKAKEKIATLGMGLENKINQPIGSLSGGQRQALTLLMSVMDDTDILLMDEPTAALDPKSAQVILALADKLNKEMGLTILFITHSLKDAQQFGNRLLHFKDGKIIRDINAEEKKRLTLQNIYEWFEE